MNDASIPEEERTNYLQHAFFVLIIGGILTILQVKSIQVVSNPNPSGPYGAEIIAPKVVE